MNQYEKIKNILILDDEKFSRENLALTIYEILGKKVNIHKASNLAEGKKILGEYDMDVIFLDINLSGEFGLDFINERISKTIPVIIVSGHNEYGIIALKKGVVDYILKPLITSELETAINKANSFIKNNRNTVNKDSDKLIILNKGSFQVLHIKDIIYFESEGNYTKIHLSNGQVILSSKTLKIFEDEIKNNTIIRISRSILFNTSYMIGFKSVNNKKYVVIKNNHLLEVSLNRWEEFQEFLNRQYNVL